MTMIRYTRIQRFCLHDGPGIRTTVFLFGCNLRCPWCCNPENLEESAAFPVHEADPEELVRELLRDQVYFGDKGGVTFSGGEPLLQAEALVPVMEALRAQGVRIAIETALFVDWESVERVLHFVDDFIVDVKVLDTSACTDIIGGNLDVYLSSLSRLVDCHERVHLRLPLVGPCGGEKNLEAGRSLAQRMGLDEPEYLPGHDLGEEKRRVIKEASRESFDIAANTPNVQSDAVEIINTASDQPPLRYWALNLPQFYETRENNEWWGKGFTEWESVRNAKPLYAGHIQPLVPFNRFYYDLSKKETIQWQADLAQKFGIECFVFYHYWYEGRRLLDKPCEMLLNSSEIEMPFCFCWANHSWTRAWDGKDHEILVAQTYGGRDEWEEHFQYLLPFFNDKRYMRIDGKPVIFIYKPGDITDGDERIRYWNSRLRSENIADGLYVVEYISSFNTSPSLCESQAVFEDEPNFSCRFEISALNKGKRVLCKKLKRTDYQNYDKIWKLIIRKRRRYDGKMIVLGGFPQWDNSPRKGRNSRVIRGASPVKFKRYLEELSNTERPDSLGIVLLNAWNEWGEGAILEPTEQDGYGYLEAIREVVASRKSNDSDVGEGNNCPGNEDL